MPGRVIRRLTSTQLALCALAGAGVVGGAVTGAVVAGSVYPTGAAPAAAVVRHVVPVAEADTEAGGSALRYPTPSLRAKPAAAKKPRVRVHHRKHVAHPARRTVPVHAVAPTITATQDTPAAATETPTVPTPAPTPAATQDTAAAVAKPAPVVRPTPPAVVHHTPSPDPAAAAPKPSPDPQPTGGFDDSG